MMFKKNFAASCLIFLSIPLLYAKEAPQAQKAEVPVEASDQQISDFSLVGYGEKGKKNWDIAGKSADIYDQEVQLKDVNGNLYGKNEDVNLTADKGNFNKANGKVHLEDNVIITTSGGAKMTTDSLDWDRKAQLVQTRDKVNIEKDNIVVNGEGASGSPELKKMALEKDIKMDINPTPEKSDGSSAVKEKVTVTCDGPLEVDYDKNIATFNTNVKVERSDLVIYGDKMDVYFKQDKGTERSQNEPGLMGGSIDKIVTRGNVRIVRGENTSYSDEATYNSADKKITLTGSPRLVIYSAKDMQDAPLGN